MNREYQICKRCIMDTTDIYIEFDENGICNHCRGYDEKLKILPFKNDKERQQKLEPLVFEIKEKGKGQEYDCVIGVSGGVDSSYAAYIVKKLGLRPLAIHVDNGWDCEFAVKNVENMVKKLGIDLHSYVIDWEEFKDLQLAFLRASVLDLEMLSDNAIIAGIYRIAQKKKIKYFLSGVNNATESIMPCSWNYPSKFDSLNIKSIYKRFGSGRKLRSFPLLSFFEFIKRKYSLGYETIPILNYVPYNKKAAMKTLQSEFGWKEYGDKHHESIITRFYQAYILPKKFNIDKRRAHLSSLICSGQITRDDALKLIEEDLYESDKLEKDKEYFLKKLEITENEFENYMNAPFNSHYDYPSYEYWVKQLIQLKNFGRNKSMNLHNDASCR